MEDWTKSTTGHKQIGGAHDIQWIKPGLPGEGNFLIFNNGQYLFEATPQSYIFEINGFLDASGRTAEDYVNPPDAGYYTWVPENKDSHKAKKNMANQIVWKYFSKSNQGFFSHIGSGAQRLLNGNTLICAMTEGHIFEVTSEGELVWEYISPVTKEGLLEILYDDWPMTNSVFRAYRYDSSHPALAGRTLFPSETITGKLPDYNTPEDSNTKTSNIEMPKSMNIAPAFPNPFNPGTTILYDIATQSHIHIFVTNIAGQQIDVLVDDMMTAGSHSLYWNAIGLPSGAYFITFKTAAFTKTIKCIHAK